MRYGRREFGQVLRPGMGCRLEPRGELDERGLAEGSAKEADPQRNAKYRSRGHLYDRITLGRSETRAAEQEMVAVQQQTALERSVAAIPLRPY